jgi:predicted lysophospholipase L1 biosynthesis ABC-type transport system permease subunit
MTFAGDTPQLADVKAVDDTYPLYGTCRPAAGAETAGRHGAAGPTVDGAAEPENRRLD